MRTCTTPTLPNIKDGGVIERASQQQINNNDHKNDTLQLRREREAKEARLANLDPIRPYALSMKWLIQWSLFVSGYSNEIPGSIDNNHLKYELNKSTIGKGFVKNKDYFSVTQNAWEYLQSIYGGGPKLSTQSVPSLFDASSKIANEIKQQMKEIKKLKARCHKEALNAVTKNEGNELKLVLCKKWYLQWVDFVNNKNKDLLPGPIDNNHLDNKCNMEMVSINAKKGNDYIEISEQAWKYYVGIYGGGPKLKKRPLQPSFSWRNEKFEALGFHETSKYGKLFSQMIKNETINVPPFTNIVKLERNKIKMTKAGGHIEYYVKYCEKELECKEFFNKMINIDPKYLNSSKNQCFCLECRKLDEYDSKTIVFKRGNPSENYVLPIGWTRFGILANNDILLKTNNKYCLNDYWTKSHVAYHGTYYDNIYKIIKSGQLKFPGDITYDGSLIKIRDGHYQTATKELPVKTSIFMSPSIIYASYKNIYAYEKSYKLKKGIDKKFKCCIEVRIMPNVYKKHKQTVLTAKDKHLRIDLNISNDKIEWFTEQRGVHIITGVLIKSFP